MISLDKLKILTPLQKLPKNVRDLGKLIVAKGLKKLPKVQKIAQSGHTDAQPFEGLAIQFFNGTLTASFSFFFSLFKQPLYNFYNNMM